MASVCTEQIGKETNILCLYSHRPSRIQRRANVCALNLKSLKVIYINFDTLITQKVTFPLVAQMPLPLYLFNSLYILIKNICSQY